MKKKRRGCRIRKADPMYQEPLFFPRNFPYLQESDAFTFPPFTRSTPEGIVAVGGNTSPGMLLSAYSQGIFPWYSPGQPILWWSPDPRFLLLPGELHIPERMIREMKKQRFTITMDRDFSGVIRSCAEIERKHEDGTWITDEMISGYTRLHQLGYAHSVEVWDGSFLAGGLYGVSLGGCFFGESMFTRVSNASKIALFSLVEALKNENFIMVDCQVYTKNLDRFGAKDVEREHFYRLLLRGLEKETLPGRWDYNFEAKRISSGR